MIYLDHAATTPMSRKAIATYRHVAELYYGNASSLHEAGTEASRILEGSRAAIASILGVSEKGLYITGSGSEASFLILASVAKQRKPQGRHVIISAVEHSSVLNAGQWLAEQGFEVTELGVNEHGLITKEALERALRPDTILCSIQHANSETGVMQDLETLGALLSERSVFFHSDCVQTFCKVPVQPDLWKLDALTVSAHKIGGPKGVGAAWIRPSKQWTPFIPGTTHERRFRPGTVDVPAAAAFAAAAKERFSDLDANAAQCSSLAGVFSLELKEQLGEQVVVVGEKSPRLPHIFGLKLPAMEGQYAMLECSQRGVGMSTGSACRVNEQQPSPTMLALGYSEQDAMQFVRLSLDADNTEEEIRKAVKILAGVIEKHSNMITL
ncbi:MAG: IscS subfamily cysteine desulfurase [Balneolaceae bacterium]